jgi:hypothetical protein
MRSVILLLAAMGLHAADLKLTSPSMEVALDPQSRGALRSLVDRASGREFIAPQKAATLFRIKAVGADGKTRDFVAADAASFEHTATGDGLVLRYRKLAGLELNVECRVRLGPKDALSRWRISVENRSPLAVQTVFYPVVVAPTRLGPESEDDRILSPGNGFDGELRISQGLPTPFPGGSRAMYPGRLPAQFVTYYDMAAGLYVAAYDSQGNTKRLGFTSGSAGIDLSVQHEVWGRPGANWTVPYDVVLGTFHGDWHAAADIYRAWARLQPWCSRKLAERRDIPAWYLEGRPLVLYVPRGGEYYLADRAPRAPDLYRSRPPLPAPGLFPSAPALFADVGRAVRSPIVVIEYGWEKHGMWVTPDVFPPYGGEEVFRNHVAALRRNGHHVCGYVSGTHWGLTKPGKAEFNGGPAFRKDGIAGAVTGEDQQPVINTSPWATNARLCIGSPVTHKVMLDIVRGLAERGVALVQYDQNVGGESYPCHNRGHSHTAGYGPWMAQETRRFLTEARRLGKSIDPEFALTIEEPCEYFIQDLDGFNDRPYVTSRYAESAPVFSYLYHGYQLSFGGDSALGLHLPEADLMRIARTFVGGLLVEGPTFGTSREWPRDELDLLGKIAHAQRTFAREYAILGEMLPEPRIENVPLLDATLVGGTRDVPLAIGARKVPAVLTSAWKSAAGKTGWLLVNVTSEPARPVLYVGGTGDCMKISESGAERLALQEGRATVPLGPRDVVLVER